jgi:uncharacterized protein (TIGR02217 family)
MSLLLEEFVEVRFPEDISYGAIGGPVFSTDIVETNNAKEYRNANWQEGRLEFNVSYGVRTENQFQRLLSFFRARRGRAVGFRFKDWSDFKVVKQLIAIGDGKTKVYQLIKVYNSGGAFEIRKIFKPVENSLRLYEGNSLVNFTVNYSNGLIVLNKPLNVQQKLFADFEFDVPVRFDSDIFKYSNPESGVYSCSDLKVKEIKIINNLTV